MTNGDTKIFIKVQIIKKRIKSEAFGRYFFPRCRIPASECSDTGGSP